MATVFTFQNFRTPSQMSIKRAMIGFPHCLSRCLHLFWSKSVKNIGGRGSSVAQSVERATPGQEVPGSIPAVAARSLLVGSVSV